jgi:outer membrane immunogenic protein
MRLNSALCVGLLVAITGGSALAADLPGRPPVMLPAPAPFSWTGAYFGIEGGYNWASAKSGFSISSTTLSGLPPVIPTVDASGSRTMSLQGGMVGAEAGYNWQANDSFVVGVEGDANWSGLSGSMVNGGPIPVVGGVYSIAQQLKTDFYGSLRGRYGFTPFDRLMIFATGGAAFAHINYTSAFTDTFNENENVSIKGVKTGWVVGAGVEYALVSNWSAKIEYLHSQFAASSGTGTGVLTDGTVATISHSTGSLAIDTVRIGLNYQFQ